MDKSLVIAFVLFCFPVFLFSQSAAQQAKIDSLMSYINLQLMNGKTPDQKYVDSCNAVIRSMNVQTARADSSAINKADSVTFISKQVFAGSVLTVPEGKIWQVKRVYVNDGGSANILVTSVKYERPFKAGEKIYAPVWSAEGALLNGDSTTFSYIFQIEETDVN